MLQRWGLDLSSYPFTSGALSTRCGHCTAQLEWQPGVVPHTARVPHRGGPAPKLHGAARMQELVLVSSAPLAPPLDVATVIVLLLEFGQNLACVKDFIAKTQKEDSRNGTAAKSCQFIIRKY